MELTPCKICGHETRSIGAKRGRFIDREFHFARCGHCGFVAVADPCTDYASLYDDRYYRGEGADPLVDYAGELAHPDTTVRHYEWRGIVELLEKRTGSLAQKQWLDYGCGAGGLVRYVNAHSDAQCLGYDIGAFVPRARAAGIPILSQDELSAMAERFDIITMIEVIEHVSDPIDVLRRVATLLRPGGTLFLTTGNAKRHERSFFTWPYVVPEIHVSYFTPESLRIAFTKVDLAAVDGGYQRGWTDIIRFKVLKSLGFKRRSVFEQLLPWPVLSRLANWKVAASAQPLASKG